LKDGKNISWQPEAEIQLEIHDTYEERGDERINTE
jgi:hypothetical protein